MNKRFAMNLGLILLITVLPLMQPGLWASAFSGPSHPRQVSANLSLDIVTKVTWTSKTAMPTPRWSAGVTSTAAGTIYVIGGTNNSVTHHPSLATVEEYDPVTDTWIKHKDMPVALEGASVVGTDDGKLYTFGGRYWINNFGMWFLAYERGIHIYDPQTDSWTDAGPTNLSPNRVRAFAAAVKGSNGKIYLFGGQSDQLCAVDECLNYADEYDPSSNTWRNLANLPGARVNAAAVEGINGKFYVFGGESYYGPYDTVFEYDPALDSWQTKTPMPGTWRTGLTAAAASNGRIYVIGGKGSMQNMTSTVEEYDPMRDQWLSKPSMITPRWLLGSAIINDRIYAIGGDGNCCTDTPLGTTEEGLIETFDARPIFLPVISRN